MVIFRFIAEKPKEVKKAPFEAPVERDPKAVKKEHHTRHGAKDHHHPEGSSNPRKRQFDRKSGTGRGKEVAKGGAGGANWGNDKLEALKAEKHIAGDAEVVEVTATEEAVVEAEPVEPEPIVFTLDEYQRRRAEQTKVNSEAFSEVKIREVSADFAGMKTSENTESDFIAMRAAKAAKAKKEQRSTSKTVVLDVSFTAPPVEQPERERRTCDRERGGDRGGRGGDRGDRPRTGRGDKARGEGRGGRGEPRAARAPRGPKVDVNDASAFPSL